jgi:hypothetical protein
LSARAQPGAETHLGHEFGLIELLIDLTLGTDPEDIVNLERGDGALTATWFSHAA